VPFAYADAKDFKYRQGGWNTGTDFLANTGALPPAQQAALAAEIKGMLIAWDPVQQKAVWTVQHPYFWNAGVLTTGGGLVFQGAAEGDLAAYDATNGTKLWSYKTTNGVIAAPMTYELNGEQYLAVMVGEGGAGQISSPAFMPQRPRLPGRLLVFKLGGTATAPAYTPPPVLKVDLTKVSSTGSVNNGYAVFNENCQVCHGPNASGQWLPKLPDSIMISTPDDFRSVVIDGAKAHNGMASFKRFLTDAEVEDVRAFLIATAKGQPTPATTLAKAGK
jgi:mono/diheme cytochrome c family protein